MPDSINYKRFLTRDEISAIGSNPKYSSEVISILSEIPDIVIEEKSLYNDYITVSGIT